MLAGSFTATMFLVSNFRMSGPSVKTITRCLQCDVSLFTMLQITMDGRSYNLAVIGRANCIDKELSQKKSGSSAFAFCQEIQAAEAK